MRLLELVRCGRPATADDETLASKSSATAAKLRRQNFRGQAAAAWQPSLGPISEDGVQLLISPEKFPPMTPAKARKHPEKRKGQKTANAHHRVERGDFSEATFADQIPKAKALIGQYLTPLGVAGGHWWPMVADGGSRRAVTDSVEEAGELSPEEEGDNPEKRKMRNEEPLGVLL
ncbi:hypothetical protein KSP39_PZI021407 [Platanthera zijinensis]|uniref:Uncharacterized protein n=1 Tax=Platanthera zijinensis TaxID=2320716 RepID=A0AAP0AXX3_9ASPA